MNEINVQIPDFISKDFFAKILKNGLKTDNIQIENFQITLGSTTGENYTSKIYRAIVTYHLQNNGMIKEISLIIKSMDLKHELRTDTVEAFDREVMMYSVIMPKIEKLYKNELFVPKCFYTENQAKYQNVVLEDLRPLGYNIADRIKRLDETHSKALLHKVARYHAATIVLAKMEPEIFKPFDKGFFQSEQFDENTFQSIFVGSLEQLIKFVSNWNGYEIIVKKLKNIHENFHDKLKKFLTSNSTDIRVLNHSDLWTNNILFKYENNKITGVRLIDLQLSTNDSLGMDINYFFSTSVNYNLLKLKREELLHHYYISFRDALRELHYPENNLPTWEAVKNEVKKREFFGFITAIGVTPLIMLDRESSKDSSIDTLFNNDIFKKKRAVVYTNPEYVEFMKYSLKRFNDLGILD